MNLVPPPSGIQPQAVQASTSVIVIAGAWNADATRVEKRFGFWALIDRIGCLPATKALYAALPQDKQKTADALLGGGCMM